MKPDFSEFSYGYAVTEELVNRHHATIIAAPMFPSLYDEGKAGGGYDVQIPLSGMPVFLQFKTSDCLEGANAKEHRSGHLGIPYYRMHLRPTKHSDQHNLLLKLESFGDAVFYIAPEFHLFKELNSFYLGRTVVAHSAAFSPQAIGSLDDKEHYVVFEKAAAFGYLCSAEPVRVAKINLYEGLHSALIKRGIEARKFGEPGLREIAQRMFEVLIAGDDRLKARQKSIDVEGLRKIVENRNLVESVGYMARTFFEAELLILK